MKNGFVVIAVCLVVFLFGCASHEAGLQENGLKPMTQAELESLLSNGFEGTFETSKSSGTIQYNPDKTASSTWSGGSGSGTYEIKNGLHCVRWDFRNNVERCGRWYKVNEKEYHVVDPDSGTLFGKMYLK
ncbi:MAG: hypothetical protein JRG88_05630 [Deltaproteobacteria bacterium]|nr:hypothetical protein [Deltaproteobacteria bacterium]